MCGWDTRGVTPPAQGVQGRLYKVLCVVVWRPSDEAYEAWGAMKTV